MQPCGFGRETTGRDAPHPIGRLGKTAWHSASEPVRLAWPVHGRALPLRLQSRLPHLPQRRPGMAPRVPAHHLRPGRAAFHRASPGLAGRHRRFRRRTDHCRRTLRLSRRHRSLRPARETRHQRHAARRPGRRPRPGTGRGDPRGRERARRPVSRPDRRQSRCQDSGGKSQPGLRSGPGTPEVLRFPHDPGSPALPLRHRRRAGAAARGLFIDRQCLRAPEEDTCPR